MKYKEKTKGNKARRGHSNNLTAGAFGKRKMLEYETIPNCLRVIPKSKRKV